MEHHILLIRLKALLRIITVGQGMVIASQIGRAQSKCGGSALEGFKRACLSV